MKNSIHFWSYLFHFFLEWEMFQTKVAQKIKTHIFRSVTFFFFRKSCRLWNNMEKCRTWLAADDNMAHAHCVLDTKGYKYTLRWCNTYCFYTATMVAWTHLSITIKCIAGLVFRCTKYRVIFRFAKYEIAMGGWC